MNLILFESREIAIPLDRADPRAIHLLDTLHMRTGDRFDAGIINGPRGKARIAGVEPDSIHIEFEPGAESPPPDPVDLIAGLPRPQSARKILHDAAALGVRNIGFVATGRSDPNYARSRLWSSGEWRRHLIAGAQQAFDTRLPRVTWGRALTDTAEPEATGPARFAFDNYEAAGRFATLARTTGLAGDGRRTPVCLAFGPERGWSDSDRLWLRSAGFTLASLGRRVLRVETAIVTAVAILRSELGWD